MSRIGDGAHTAAVALHLTPHVVPIEGHRDLARVRLRLRVRVRGSARLGLTLFVTLALTLALTLTPTLPLTLARYPQRHAEVAGQCSA